MRISSAASFALCIGAMIGLFGCSSNIASPSNESPILAGAGTVNASGAMSAHVNRAAHANRTGASERFLPYARLRHHAQMVRPGGSGVPTLLAVSDTGTLGVDLLNKKYVYSGAITDGINGPGGNFIDGHGNLYIANYDGANVTEYPSKGTSPSFTYSAGLSDPVNVTTDPQGNVYVADYNQGNAGVIVEYPQDVNTPSFTCSTGLANDGIAVNNKGDVFVAGNDPTAGSGQLMEYAGGLGGCNALSLGVTLGMAGGLQIDKKGNLVACDQSGSVDIIPAPYDSISKTIGGAIAPFRVAMNKKDSLIYIVDIGNFDVLVDKYPSGTPITTLGSASGLYEPFGVATFPYQ